jgi:nicotinate-nucleotide adenylyltransferase
MNAQGEGGNNNAGQGKKCNQIAHLSESDAIRALCDERARYDRQMEPTSTPNGRRIAFFGGSFDPPHLGHLAVARAARAALALDAVLFAPVGAQPLKPQGSTASFEDRLAMTELAIAGEPGFELSMADAPKPSGAPNFTVDTLADLRAGLGQDGALFCLMGADSFFGLRRWHRSSEIPFIAPLIVASRPGQKPEHWLSGLREAIPAGLRIEPEGPGGVHSAGVEMRAYRIHGPHGGSASFYLLPGLYVDISASQIRDQVQAGCSGTTDGRTFLPQAVFDYVRSHGLYR